MRLPESIHEQIEKIANQARRGAYGSKHKFVEKAVENQIKKDMKKYFGK